MPKRPRESTDPSSHHGFLDGVDEDPDKKPRRRRQQDRDEDPDSLDLDRIL